MFDLYDLIIVLLLAAIAAFFWQLRYISEQAYFHAERACRQRRLQLLNVARSKAKLGVIPGAGIGWQCEYLCEFSTDGINQLTARIEMQGQKLKAVNMPLYPEPEWQQAPTSQGRISMGGCGGGSSTSCGSKKQCGSSCR